MTDYRYRLVRRLEMPEVHPRDPLTDLLWIMLNPSTADDERDDHTVRCCMRLSRNLGYRSMTVVNMFAARATKPARLFRMDDPVGPLNEEAVRGELVGRPLAIAAWGVVPKPLLLRRPPVEEWALAANVVLYCFGLTMGGYPRHPSRLPANPPLVPYRFPLPLQRARTGPIQDTAPL